MDSKRNASFSGASSDGAVLYLLSYNASHFASSSLFIKLYEIVVNNIISTKTHSVDHSIICDNKIRVSKTIKEAIKICGGSTSHRINVLEL